MPRFIKNMVLCQCLSVPKANANRMLSYLLKRDMVRKDLKIRFEAGNVYIPVRQRVELDGATTRELDFSGRDMPVSPVERTNAKLRAMGIADKFPEKFIMLGKALLVKEARLARFPRKAYPMIAEEFGVESLYVDRGITLSPLREPDISLLWGKNDTITHEENGVFYTFDPARVMFSPGNVNARIGASSNEFNGKTVVDMFAGIGYFTLQMARGSPGSRIYACEKNPESYRYLEQNVRNNGLEGIITPLQGDCRLTTSGIEADYVLMGHFDSMYFLPAALGMSHQGTIINLHVLCDTSGINASWQGIQERARHLGYLLDFNGQRVVKSYGPHLWHTSVRMSVRRVL